MFLPNVQSMSEGTLFCFITTVGTTVVMKQNNRRMEIIAIRFQRVRFVVQVRRFVDMKTIYKFLSKDVKAVCSCRLKE